MNIEKLKQAEADFLDRYPGGFENPEMLAIAKKHKMDQMVSYTQESFGKENFRMPDMIPKNVDFNTNFVYAPIPPNNNTSCRRQPWRPTKTSSTAGNLCLTY